MTRVGRGLLVVLGGVAWVFVLTAAPAAASTTVKVKDEVVTITVPIDCAGCKGAEGPDGSDLAKYWEKTAEKTWNDAFAKYPYCSTYKFELDVKINAKGADFKGKKGDHLVQVGSTGGSAFPPSGFEHRSGGKDNTDAYGGDFDGAWDIDIPPVGIPHEIGHLLGLADDYDIVSKGPPRVTRPKPGRGNTLMADGGPVDKALIDRIGKQLEKLGTIDTCQVWKGTVRTAQETSNSADPCSPNPIRSHGQLVVEVGAKGNVIGTFGPLHSPGATCRLSTIPASDDGPFPVQGHKTSDVFILETAGQGTATSFTLPVKGDSAKATRKFESPGSYPYEVTLTLHCTNCDEAVG